VHKVTQYKTGKASTFAQGKRRYDRKQSGYGYVLDAEIDTWGWNWTVSSGFFCVVVWFCGV
jgi:hypothetical protein